MLEMTQIFSTNLGVTASKVKVWRVKATPSLSILMHSLLYLDKWLDELSR